MNNGTITRDDIREVAKEVSNFLESQGIKEMKDLEGKVGTVLEVRNRPGHSIRVDSRPSNENTTACTLYYRVIGKGIPFETRLNSKLKYTKTFIKGDFDIDGYSHFDTDDFGNKAQEMYAGDCSIKALKTSLKALY